MLARFIVYALCALIGVTQLPLIGQAFTPTSAYQSYSVQGFTVFVNREVLMHREAAIAASQELESQLAKIDQVVPAEALKTLQSVRIWMEWNARKAGAAEFHPSAGWLRKNGYNPEKAGCVEISNVLNFVKWSQNQPWMVLHELSHAYHFLAPGEDDRRIKAAYRQAMSQHLYDLVEYWTGAKRKAYAAVNFREYFAELSEAYFGRNDFYPFTRSQLQEYDSEGFRLMQQVWKSY